MWAPMAGKRFDRREIRGGRLSVLMLSERKGVAELTGALIMIVLTLAGFGLYFGVLQSKIGTSSGIAIQQYQVHQVAAGEMIGLVYSEASTTGATLYLVNCGSTPIHLAKAFLTAGTTNTQLTPSICVPSGDSCAYSDSLQAGKLSKVVFGFPTASVPEKATLFTDNHAVFQFVLNAAPVTVSNTAISTALSSSAINVGYPVTDSATLAGVSGTAGGTVSYYYSTVSTCPSSGAVMVGSAKTVTGGSVPDSDPQQFSVAGSYYWYAVYSGDADNAGSTSKCEPLVVRDFTVGADPASTTITAGGSPGAFTVTASGLSGFTGTVALSAGSSPPGLALTFSPTNVVLGTSSSSTLTARGSTAGAYAVTITATSGTIVHTTTVSVTVLAASSTSVTCAKTTIAKGESTTCTATVSGSSPTGSVAWSQSGTGSVSVPASCNLASGSCTVTVTGTYAGSVSVAASYGGNGGNGPSSGSASLSITKRAVSVSVVCTPSSIPGKGTADCVVTVTDTSPGTAVTPTGTVSFTASKGSFPSPASCTLAGTGASATCHLTYTAPSNSGSYLITATYPGDNDHSGGSGTFTERVA